MKHLILTLALVLSACAPEKHVSHSDTPTATPNPIREPSQALCEEIASNLDGSWTIQARETEVVFVIEGSILIHSEDFGLFPYNNGHVKIGDFCTLDVSGGYIVGVQ